MRFTTLTLLNRLKLQLVFKLINIPKPLVNPKGTTNSEEHEKVMREGLTGIVPQLT